MKTYKTAVITGASAGVGRETVRVFAQRGYDIALIARGDAGLAAAAREVEGFEQRCLVIPTDVADFRQVERAAARVEFELGPIDVWVNNAMTTVFSPLAAVTPEDFTRAVEVTFLGQVWGTMVALKWMRPRDRGSIINVGSALAFVGIPLQSAYCASKFACRGFFEATRAELLHDRSNVRLSMVHLPAMNTPQFDWCETTMDRHPQPVPPIYQPEVAAMAIFETAIDGKRSRIVGSWNKMLVVMDSFFPGLGNHFASLGAWNSQLTKQPVSASRPSNLRAPADSDVDFGGHGIFDNKARGVRDPSFLITLPKIAFTYLRACDLSVREMIAVRRRGELRRAGDSSREHEGSASGERLASPDAEEIDASGSDMGGSSSGVPSPKAETTSLDVLENVDLLLLGLIHGIEVTRGSEVIERYEYGNLAKEVLRHLAIRQSCLADVSAAISSVPALHDIGVRMATRATERRVAIDEATKMARAVQPVALNEGQDFDGVFDPLLESLTSEIEWELSTAIPAIREAFSEDEAQGQFRAARYVHRHAPTFLSTRGPRWYEHAPVVSRLLTIYEHLNDFPRAAKDWRSS